MQKWSAGSTAGPRMVKQVNEALRTLRAEHDTMVEVFGVKGNESHHTVLNIFGRNNRPDVSLVQEAIGERYGWTVEKGTYKAIIADVHAAMPELIKNRPVRDQTRTPEEEAERQEEARKQKRKEEEEERLRAVHAIAATHPHLVKTSETKMSSHALGAANIRTELARAFPGITFRVKSDSFAGGTSIDVGWDMGPTEKEVNAVVKRFQYGSFDGMTDSYSTDADSYAFYKVFGGAKYVQTSRNLIQEEREAILKSIGPEQKDRVWELFSKTSFLANEKVCGYGLSEETGDYCILKVATGPAPVAELGACAGSAKGKGITVSQNEEKDGVEIRFTGKPSSELRSRMKANGFRCTRRPPWVWYKRRTPAALAFAYDLAGREVEIEGADDHSGQEDRECGDMAYEENCRVACGL